MEVVYAILRPIKSSTMEILLEYDLNEVQTWQIQETQAFILQKQLTQSIYKKQMIRTMR